MDDECGETQFELPYLHKGLSDFDKFGTVTSIGSTVKFLCFWKSKMAAAELLQKYRYLSNDLTNVYKIRPCDAKSVSKLPRMFNKKLISKIQDGRRPPIYKKKVKIAIFPQQLNIFHEIRHDDQITTKMLHQARLSFPIGIFRFKRSDKLRSLRNNMAYLHKIWYKNAEHVSQVHRQVKI